MADITSSSGHLADKVASLRATAEALTHEDATRSGHCQGLSRSIEQDYEEQLAAGSATDAQDYLLAAHAVFRAKGLQTACRIVLGKLARLANEHNLREGFNRAAVQELAADFALSKLDDPADRADFLGIELECWVAARPLLVGNRVMLQKLADIVQQSVRDVDIRWQAASTPHLWRIIDNSSRLLKFAVSELHGNGTEASELALGCHFLGDFASCLVREIDLSTEPEGSPARPLAYPARAALDEFFDLSVPTKMAEVGQYIRLGQVEAVQREGVALADSIGRLVCKLGDAEQAAARFLTLMGGFAQWWHEMLFSPSIHVDGVRAGVSEAIARSCDAFKCVMRRCDDADALGGLALETEKFIDSQDVRALTPPASSLAPLYLTASCFWERVADLQNDRYSADQAFLLAQESLRLFIQQRYSPRMSLADAIDCVERLRRSSDLEPVELGYLELAKGNLALRRGDPKQALQRFKAAITELDASIADPNIPGIRNLTLLTARAYEDAGVAAERMGDASCVSYLEGAARVLEEQAQWFKVDRSRHDLLSRADRYRGKAKNAAERLKRREAGEQ